jgi:para-aminobenzoate synthetase component 1
MTHPHPLDIELPLVERLDPRIEPVDVFLRLACLPHVVFFDSALRHSQLGRWSFIAADPVEWIEVPADGSDALGHLERRLLELPTTTRPGLPPFSGGFAGLFGYELGRSLEQLPAAAVDEFQMPALAVGLYDVVVAFDHLTTTAWLISQGIPETDLLARQERAAARLAQFRAWISGGELSAPGNGRPAQPLTVGLTLSADDLATQHAVTQFSGLTSNFSNDGYQHAVQRAIDYVYAGDVFQVNLSQRLLYPAATSSIELYCRLRERNPAPFAGYFDAGSWQVCSASPERFLHVHDRHVETRPIKGTRGRMRRPEADLFAGDELRASAKDRAENVMIVDLVRNDLSRTCRPDSVRVLQLCGLETYEYVQHLVSVVGGTLRDQYTPCDLLRTSFPGGSVTGAPKIRAMEIIAELEPTARGAYCGSFGYVGLDGRMDTSILIRTITAGRGWWQLPVGGGIVAQSDPSDELEETWHKAQGLLRALKSH